MSAKYIKMLLAMLNATGVTLEVFFLTLIFSLPFGLIIAFGRMSKHKIISTSTNIFLLIIRGTPLMLQLLIVYFGPLILIKWINSFGYNIIPKYNRVLAAIIALVINYAAYFAEIYRGGIESIPKGQYEAAKVLGYTNKQTFFKIILPQVIKRIVPATGNEVITLVKDTALVSVLSIEELMMITNRYQSLLFSFVPLLIAGVFYFMMNWGVSLTFSKIEKKLSYYN